jgi:hypothetical protein
MDMQHVSHNAGIDAPRNSISENVVRITGRQVYAALYSDGWVKVGVGIRPKDRIAAHNSISMMRKATLVRSVISGNLANSAEAEAELIKFCSSQGRLAFGKEWFEGVDFDALDALITDRFSGDPDSAFIVERDARDSINGRADALDLMVTDQKHWLVSASHASAMMSLYLNDGYGGSLFRAGESGAIPFLLDCSLALYGLGIDERADLYSEVVMDPEGALSTIHKLARNTVRKSESAHPGAGGEL